MKIIADCLPSDLKQTVNEWTKGHNYLIAIELSNPPGNIIKLKHPKNPAKSITLHYSQGNYIELTNIEENNWASRAIKNTQINLSDNDLTEFLLKAKIRLLLCLRFTIKILHTFI